MTALTEERGVKITTAAVRLKPAARRQVAEQLLEALIAVPLLSSEKDVVFHGDPHAGNLLYDVHTGTLAIIDWALRERLGREQRRQLALLFLMVSLRDPIGTSSAIVALSQRRFPIDSPQERLVSEKVSAFLTEMPASTLPSAADAMRLLERVAIAGIKFPGSLIMLSKVMFTLEGLLSDIAGADAAKGLTIVRHAAQHWIANRSAYRSPLEAKDWFVLQSSMLLYPSRLWLRWEQKALDRLTRKSSAPRAATGT
jgi:predicted unusual protein kinase regulating ubiquinone biosynthesis (AarF/ABC1/UbiB family)